MTMVQVSVTSVQSEISKRISEKFGVKNTDFKKILSKVRGKLPRGFEEDIAYLFEAEERMKHPKRRGQVDLQKLEAIQRSSLAKLDSIDLARDRERARAMLLAEFAARMLLFIAGVVGLLFWFDVI
jgi:hypothetical protein